MFTFNDHTMEKMSLCEAQNCLNIAPDARSAIRAMAQKIPETQHEMFTVVLDNIPTSDTYRSILTVALTADASMEEMNKLYVLADKAEVEVDHGLNRAVHHERGDPLGSLIQNGTTAHKPDRTKDYGELVYVSAETSENPYETAAENYRKRGIDYQGSYLLDAALTLPNLSHGAADKLQRVAGALKLGVRDAFTVDIAKNAEGECDVVGLAISPNVIGAVTGITMRYHRKTMELNADQFNAVADAVGRDSRKRA